MSSVINSIDFGKELCKILNLDAKKTRTITIEVVPDGTIYVQVGQYLLKDESNKLLELIKHYKLEERDTPDEIR